jgi:hypothetical protein
MGFYYFSLFSWMAFLFYFAIAAAIILKICQANKLSNRWKASLLVVTFIAPWTEELWISYNFGQLCRNDAGKFIYKTVNVDGFYDDATEWGTRQLSESGYKFMESRENLGRERLWRVERVDNVIRDRTIALDVENNRGKLPPDHGYIEFPVSDDEKIIVAPDRVHAWRRMKIDKPTARYHYIRDLYGNNVAHKILRVESRVTDSSNGEILGRYVSYGRRPYWFFIGLDQYPYSCDGPEAGPHTTRFALIYEEVLKPKK